MENKRLHDAPSTTKTASTGPDGARQRAIARGLQKLFDDVVNEPVPEELLRLLENADKREPPS